MDLKALDAMRRRDAVNALIAPAAAPGQRGAKASSGFRNQGFAFVVVARLGPGQKPTGRRRHRRAGVAVVALGAHGHHAPASPRGGGANALGASRGEHGDVCSSRQDQKHTRADSTTSAQRQRFLRREENALLNVLPLLLLCTATSEKCPFAARVRLLPLLDLTRRPTAWAATLGI